MIFRQTSPTLSVARITVCALLLLCGVVAFSQSGRRGSKSPAVPVPSPEEKKPETKEAADNVSRIPLIVGTSSDDVFTGIPSNLYDTVLDSCAVRLHQSSIIRVETVGKGFSRSDAVQRAKREVEGYVVWLHLRGDDVNASYANNLDQIYIEYYVFEHSSAKVKTSGNSYQGSSRLGGVVMSPGTGRYAAVEARMRAAAEDAADRILKGLHLGSDIPVNH